MPAKDHLLVHLADAVELTGEDRFVDLVEPWRIDRGPKELALAQVLLCQVAGILRDRLQ